MKGKGFTLVELLIVVAILGILATATIFVINPAQQVQNGRDFKRKSDLSSVQTALEQYRSDQKTYPVVTASPLIIGACGAAFNAPSGTNYLSKIPCDPIPSNSYNGGSYYYYSDGTTYTLAACLENTSDPAAVGAPATPAGSGSCSSSKYYVVTNQ